MPEEECPAPASVRKPGPRNHDSKGGEKKMIKVSVHYPNRDGSMFDIGR